MSIHYHAVAGSGHGPNPYLTSLPQPGFVSDAPRVVQSTVREVVEQADTVLTGSGLTPAVKAAMGVGIPTATAGAVRAVSAASTAITARNTSAATIANFKDQLTLSKGTLNESLRKNFVDETTKKEELAMAKE